MGSKLFPNRFNGKIRDGGFLSPNRWHSQNANAPNVKGRVWVSAPGWHWIAGWKRQKDGKPFMALQLNGMTDEEATRYCARTEDRDPHRANDEP